MTSTINYNGIPIVVPSTSGISSNTIMTIPGTISYRSGLSWGYPDLSNYIFISDELFNNNLIHFSTYIYSLNSGYFVLKSDWLKLTKLGRIFYGE